MLQLGPTILGARVHVDTTGVPGKLDRVRRATDATKRSFVMLGTAAQATAAKVGQVAATVAGIGGVGLGIGLGAAVRKAAQFSDSMARVNTMLESGQSATALYGDGVKRLAVQVGQSTDVVAEGLFQALSAGVAQSEALGFLDVAAKAAVGGFTQLNVAVDGTTSVLNAYGLQASSAKRVTDAMFAANKVGKTTFEELASSIGSVAPTAAAMKVPIEDLFSAVAAGTKVGLSTFQVTRALRFALSSLAKPSAQARAEAQRLGLQWDENTLKGKTFTEWLMEVRDASNGSVASLSKLVGSSQAAGVMLALTSETGLQNFTSALNEMNSGISLTDLNAKRGLNSTATQFRRFSTQLSIIMGRIGESVLDRFFPKDPDAFIASMNEIGVKAEKMIHRVLDLVEWGVKHAHSLFRLWIATKIGGILGGIGSQLKGVQAAMVANAAATGAAAPGAAGALGKIAGATFYLQTAIIAGAAAWELGEALAEGHEREREAENRRQNLALQLPAIIHQLQSAGLVRGVGAGRTGDPNNAHLQLGRLKSQIERGALTTPASMLMGQDLKNKLAAASQQFGRPVRSQEELALVQREFARALSPKLGEIATTEVIRTDRSGIWMNERVQRQNEDLSQDIQSALKQAAEEAGAILAEKQAAEQQEQAVAQFVDQVQQFPDVLKTAGDTLLKAAGVIWDSSESLANQTIDIAHEVIDKNKKKRRHSVRLTKRGAANGKVSPRYRLFSLRSGLGGLVIQPMPENYVNSAIINAGE